MFFILSKTIGLLIQPVLHLLLLALVGFVLLRWSKKLGRMMLIAAFTLTIAYSFVGFSAFLLRPLENQIAAANSNEIAEAEGVIILGGYTGSGIVAQSRNQFTLGSAAERVVQGLVLHKQFPDKPIWFTGFSGALRPSGWSEAENTQTMLDALQVDSQNLKFEARSQNTYQNAAYMLEAVKPTRDEQWLLVTSAAHMPRAAGAFRAAGWPDMSYLPTDYRTTPSAISWEFNPGISFTAIQTAYHEYAGLFMYWLTGRWVAAY